jgi:uncharacterized surface protein with fasciclin (FAS1) repeats
MSTDLSNEQEIATLQGKKVKVTINGEGVFINDAKVTVANIEADNGVVHVIDAVMLPPVITVVDIVVGSADHDTLEAAVIAAGLADDLSGTGPFTLFAPTDDAFKALPAGTIEALLADPTGDLANILLYHVVSGKAMSTDLSNGQVIETLLGKDVTVAINGDGVFINNAKVTVANIEADNGVVHIIDAVLLPPANTGISNLYSDAGQLTIYPNPSSDKIMISNLHNIEMGQLSIVNLNGTVVLKQYFNSVSESIDISSLSPGAYFISIDAEEGKFTGKLLIK